ncbi:MAG: hypothetical protein HON53_03910 [Planctomycetaceae bacterium]|nr:hypothetical protein [Planctomycetaceae bacterium]MBT6154843.1 hypothetical protein [Planctomycetaceae bacterium]MBT6486710.1 hypothetical protein [Planctomycetaceae bacterium]MBT6494059.1 hypothetical protein [Planctomycetaceae bacterium]
MAKSIVEKQPWPLFRFDRRLSDWIVNAPTVIAAVTDPFAGEILDTVALSSGEPVTVEHSSCTYQNEQ